MSQQKNNQNNIQQQEPINTTDNQNNSTESLENNQTIIFLKPETDKNQWGSVLKDLLPRLQKQKCIVTYLYSFQFDNSTLESFYAHVKNKDFFPEMREYLTSGFCLGLLVGYLDESQNNNQIFDICRDIIGETHNYAPNSLRAKYATDATKNALHTSRKEDFNQELNFMIKNFLFEETDKEEAHN